MEDIDKAFRKYIAEKMGEQFESSIKDALLFGAGAYTTSAQEEPDEPITIDTIRDAMALLGDPLPPPPLVRVSKNAMVEPTAEPHTDDMRAMLEALGREKIPGALHIKAIPGMTDREMIVIHPDLVKRGRL